jgi:hypothetical protein
VAVKLKSYELHQMQGLVRHAVASMDELHQQWRLLEGIYRTGSLEESRELKAGKLRDFMPSLTQSVVNLILPHINIIISSVVARDPEFSAVPYEGGEEAEKNATIVDGVINYFWKRLRVTRELRDATADAVKLGTGFVKVGWTHLEDEEELSEGQRKEIALDAYERQRLDSILEDSEFSGDIEFIHGSVPHSTMRVIKSEPFVQYVSPYDIFVPQNARRMEDIDWVVHRITLPVDEIVANPEFGVSEEDIIRDGNTVNPADEYQAEWRRNADNVKGTQFSEIALDTATLWEFYDMRTRKLVVFQLEASEPMWEGDLPWSHRYPPFVHIRNFTSSGNDFWGFGDIENVASIQAMMNEFLTEQIENARRSGQKYLIRKDALTEELIAALESSESDIVAPVDVPSGEPLDQIIVPVFRAALSNDIYAAKVEMERYIREVLGINDFQAGGVGADRMSATAAAVVEGVATLRAQDKIMSVEEAAAHVGNLIFLLCQEYLDEGTAIRIAGVDGASWPSVSKSDLYGEFMVAVEGGSLKPINPAAKEEQAMRILNEIVPAIAQLGYDPSPMLRVAFRHLGYDPDNMLVQAQPQLGMQPGAQNSGTPAEALQALGAPPGAANSQLSGGIAL